MPRHAGYRVLAALLFVLAALVVLPARGSTQAKPVAKFKGIFEPVSFTEPVNLNDVFFVTDEEGWAAGAKGTIIHTSDGGRTWEAQVGGDPQADEADFNDLRFVNPTTGWVAGGSESGVQRKLLGTRDGRTWQQVGVLGDPVRVYRDYAFSSPSNGISVNDSGHILRTVDGGKSWNQVGECKARVNVGGVFKEHTCALKQVVFASPDVGYASGGALDSTLVVMKTVDGGATWTVAFAEAGIAHPDEMHIDQSLAFTSETNGVVRLVSKKLLVTSDGGKTWTAAPTTVAGTVRFADPQVAWAIAGSYRIDLAYTTNGGTSWTKRQIEFPAIVKGFALPSRQRGYVVGESGMVFRYRVVPATYKAANLIDAPAMPAR
jgi:photosystem II stability/assembly factor-like uncharacterized protein